MSQHYFSPHLPTVIAFYLARVEQNMPVRAPDRATVPVSLSGRLIQVGSKEDLWLLLLPSAGAQIPYPFDCI